MTNEMEYPGRLIQDILYDWFVLQKCEYMYFTGIKPEVPLATRILDLTDKFVNVFYIFFEY